MVVCTELRLHHQKCLHRHLPHLRYLMLTQTLLMLNLAFHQVLRIVVIMLMTTSQVAVQMKQLVLRRMQAYLRMMLLLQLVMMALVMRLHQRQTLWLRPPFVLGSIHRLMMKFAKQLVTLQILSVSLMLPQHGLSFHAARWAVGGWGKLSHAGTLWRRRNRPSVCWRVAYAIWRAT